MGSYSFGCASSCVWVLSPDLKHLKAVKKALLFTFSFTERTYLQKLLRKIRKIPRLTRDLKLKTVLRFTFERLSKVYQCRYLVKWKSRFLELWRCATKTRVKQGFFRILSEMFCKSLLQSVNTALLRIHHQKIMQQRLHQHMCSFWLTFFALQEKDGILLKVRTFNLDCCLHLDAFPV